MVTNVWALNSRVLQFDGMEKQRGDSSGVLCHITIVDPSFLVPTLSELVRSFSSISPRLLRLYELHAFITWVDVHWYYNVAVLER